MSDLSKGSASASIHEGGSVELPQDRLADGEVGAPPVLQHLRLAEMTDRDQARTPGPRWWRDARRRRMLATADAIVAAALCAALSGPGENRVVLMLMGIVAGALLAKLFGLYDADHRAVRHTTLDEVVPLWAWIASLAVLANSPITGRTIGIAAIPIALVAMAAIILMRGGARWLWRRLTPPERTLVIGEGELDHAIKRKIALFDDMHLTLAGEEGPATLPIDEAELDASLDRLCMGIDRIVLAWGQANPTVIEQLTDACRIRQVKLSVVSPFRGKARPALQLSSVAELPVLEYNTWDVSRSTAIMKRVADVAAASFALLLASPLLAVLAVMIKLEDGGPVLFRQTRAGQRGRPFKMLKFRSMWVDAEDKLREFVDLDDLTDPMFKLHKDPRVTRIGRFMRRYSLDELPQLVNVVRGQMSLVGPRPEEMEVVARYEPEHVFRLSVKPGLTGPMQVFGRGDLTFSERLEVELDYIENLSLPRDLQLIVRTVPAVLRGSGAY